jgi:phosphoglycolate phosphatase
MRAAIFDLDGTLADTSGDLIAAANATLREAGVTVALDAARDRGVALRGGRPMLRLGLGRARGGVDEALVDTLYPRLLGHYAAALDRETRLYEGVEAALAVLEGAGWRLGVCTNKPQRLAEVLLERLGIAGRFRAVLGADALPVRKPDPRHLTETILRAGGACDRAVLVGDTATDREAARAAGVPCVLVAFGPEGGDVEALEPEAVIGHFDELAALLDGLVPFAPVAAVAAGRAEASAREAGGRRGPRVP